MQQGAQGKGFQVLGIGLAHVQICQSKIFVMAQAPYVLHLHTELMLHILGFRDPSMFCDKRVQNVDLYPCVTMKAQVLAIVSCHAVWGVGFGVQCKA